MKIITRNVVCIGLLVAASTCFAQMYTVTDLGTLGGTWSTANGINAFGQVVGTADIPLNRGGYSHPYRTFFNSAINPSVDDLVNPYYVWPTGGCDPGKDQCIVDASAQGINASGQVVGSMTTYLFDVRAFRTSANSIVLPSDWVGNNGPRAYGINGPGQVVGHDEISLGAFRADSNTDIHYLGTLAPGGTIDNYGAGASAAYGINDSGQVVGASDIGNNAPFAGASHAYRTAANSPIDPDTDDLGTLGGSSSIARHINVFGQVVGMSYIHGDTAGHAFRTAGNQPIKPTDDLGTLGGSSSYAKSINNYGQVVGWAFRTGDTAPHAFVYDSGMHDLNNLISTESGCELMDAADVNDRGQIAANGYCNGQQRAVLLTPIYRAFVQPPIKADGSSVFSGKRGTVPVKFRLTQHGHSTCTLIPTTIAITKAESGTLSSIDESVYSTQADSGSNFRIDAGACQYVYNLAASALGVGTYRVDISLNGIMVGHAVFALK
jgi:probable HAF family extracellular repeat protein